MNHRACLLSEFEPYLCVYLPSREIVWHGVHLVCDISDPIVRVYVADVEKVEAVHAEPDVL